MKQFSDLKGKTLTEIRGGVGDEVVIFTTIDGEQAMLYYEHD